ncbi:unnamed protein product, partial [marine sediment metagenome]
SRSDNIKFVFAEEIEQSTNIVFLFNPQFK